MKENAVLNEVSYCLSHHRFFVIPRDTRPGDRMWSIWKEVDPAKYVGVVWRSNTGAARYGRSFVRFGVVGSPDFSGWVFGTGKTLSLEVKNAKGKLTSDQAYRLDLALKTGCLAAVVRSYADTELELKSWGFTRSQQS